MSKPKKERSLPDNEAKAIGRSVRTSQYKLNRGWSVKQRGAQICMSALCKREAFPNLHRKCEDQTRGIENLVSTKQLAKTKKGITHLTRELSM